MYLPIDDVHYLKFKPRFPNVFVRDYLLEIPSTSVVSIKGINLQDEIIIAFLGMVIAIGLFAILFKMKMLSLLLSEGEIKEQDRIFNTSITQRFWISFNERSRVFNPRSQSQSINQDEENQELTSFIK